jgi:hypothetical protein
MEALFLTLLILLGAVVVLFAILSPFLTLFYQAGRDKFFERIAHQYNLQFTKQDIPAYKTMFSDPPRAARIVEGKLNDNDISVGDYVGSIYQWGSNMNFPTGWMQTKFFMNDKAQDRSLSPFWGLASEKQIISFLDSVKKL